MHLPQKSFVLRSPAECRGGTCALTRPACIRPKGCFYRAAVYGPRELSSGANTPDVSNTFLLHGKWTVFQTLPHLGNHVWAWSQQFPKGWFCILSDKGHTNGQTQAAAEVTATIELLGQIRAKSLNRKFHWSQCLDKRTHLRQGSKWFPCSVLA